MNLEEIEVGGTPEADVDVDLHKVTMIEPRSNRRINMTNLSQMTLHFNCYVRKVKATFWCEQQIGKSKRTQQNIVRQGNGPIGKA